MRDSMFHFLITTVVAAAILGLVALVRSCSIDNSKMEIDCRTATYAACVAQSSARACAEDAALACNGAVFHASGAR